MDIDLTIAVAPGLKSILVYEADQDTNANAWIDEWNRIYTDDAAQVISCSWGSQEYGTDPAHTIFEEMALQGQTIFASAGDAGAFDECFKFALPPFCSTPTIIPHVVLLLTIPRYLFRTLLLTHISQVWGSVY